MMTTTKPGLFSSCGRPSGRQLVWAIVLGASLPAVMALLKRFNLPAPVRYALPLIPLAAGGQYVRVLVRDVRGQMDELQLRIRLEAAAVVVCGLIILMLAYPVLQAAGWVGTLDPLGVLVFIAVLGFMGYVSAARRYR